MPTHLRTAAAAALAGVALALLVNPVSGVVKATLQARTSAHQAAEALAASEGPQSAGRSADALEQISYRKAGSKVSSAKAPKAKAVAKRTAEHATSRTRKRTRSHRTATPVAKAERVRHRVGAASVANHLVTSVEQYGPQSQWVTVRHLSDAGRRPTAYFIHGGSWIAGRQDDWAAEATAWARKGWTTVNITYRLGVGGDVMLDDLTAVLADYERQPYVDKTRQIVVGNSAGGQLATLVGSLHASHFKGVIAWSPVVSPENAYSAGIADTGTKLRLATAAKQVWGSGGWRNSTPLSFVSAKTPPMWLAGSTGEFVPWAQHGGRLCAVLGSRCSSHVDPGNLHGEGLMRAHPDWVGNSFTWAQARVR